MRKEHSCRLGRTNCSLVKRCSIDMSHHLYKYVQLEIPCVLYHFHSPSSISPFLSGANFPHNFFWPKKNLPNKKAGKVQKKNTSYCFNNFLLIFQPWTPPRLSLFAKFSGRFNDTVEGRWTSGVAMEVGELPWGKFL